MQYGPMSSVLLSATTTQQLLHGMTTMVDKSFQRFFCVHQHAAALPIQSSVYDLLLHCAPGNCPIHCQPPLNLSLCLSQIKTCDLLNEDPPARCWRMLVFTGAQLENCWSGVGGRRWRCCFLNKDDAFSLLFSHSLTSMYMFPKSISSFTLRRLSLQCCIANKSRAQREST